MKKNIYLSILFLVAAASCKKDFLDRTPQIQPTASSAFKNYNNFQTYAWGLYDYFGGYAGDFSGASSLIQSQEAASDNLCKTISGGQSPYAYQTKIVPTTGSTTRSLEISGWNFSYIRQVNIMLDNIDGSTMNQTDKDHWRSVGYFFKALRYYDLVAAFGDVPWIENALTDTSSELFAARTPRDIVAKNILNILVFAESHIKTNGDGANTINVHVVRALLSRFGLFEGTWRKYQGLSDADTYLQACKTYSEKLLPVFTDCMSNYDDVYNTIGLGGKPGIILYKQYADKLSDHLYGPRIMGSTSFNLDMTKDAVESYLCKDGKPISTSTVFAGDKNMYDAFRNRDLRLYWTVVPPYKVTVGTPPNFTLTTNSADAEYINVMADLSTSNKRLPVHQWSQNMNTGTAISMSPHFYLDNKGQPQAISQLGYFFWKQYNRFPLTANTYSITDCPLFRIEEVWLNYAEAMAELGLFTQSIANATINKLRPRAGVAAMNIGSIDASFDTKRDPDVSAVLWEIRRERRVELMGDGFRFNDIKRWKKGAYLNKIPLGVNVNNADFSNKLSIFGGGQTGYVQFFPAPGGWLDKYYLEPIPTQELQLNTNFVQNPNW